MSDPLHLMRRGRPRPPSETSLLFRAGSEVDILVEGGRRIRGTIARAATLQHASVDVTPLGVSDKGGVITVMLDVIVDVREHGLKPGTPAYESIARIQQMQHGRRPR